MPFDEEELDPHGECRAEIERLQGQLPEGMKHCTIQFKECEKGHGRLTATNWIDHGCPHCAIERLRETFARLADNMAFALNHIDMPRQWYDKFCRELEEDRATVGQQGETK